MEVSTLYKLSSQLMYEKNNNHKKGKGLGTRSRKTTDTLSQDAIKRRIYYTES